MRKYWEIVGLAADYMSFVVLMLIGLYIAVTLDVLIGVGVALLSFRPAGRFWREFRLIEGNGRREDTEYDAKKR
jgi:hypothetical protein